MLMKLTTGVMKKGRENLEVRFHRVKP